MEHLSNIGTIKDILQTHGFSFSKGLGQNFLINPNICPRMAEESQITKETTVLEIGAGIGVLTHELAKRAHKVVCVEIDTRLAPILAETLADHNNITLVWQDFLEISLPDFFEKHFSGCEDIVVCANLPYYITTPIIMRILEEKLPIRQITAMVQKEAAIRLAAEPGTREVGAISLSIRYFAEPKILFPVSRGSFMPAPDVDSAVLALRIRKEPPSEILDEALFFKLVKGGFSMRRKTLSNCLSQALSLPKSVVSSIMTEANVSPSARAEALTMSEFITLTNTFSQYFGEEA